MGVLGAGGAPGTAIVNALLLGARNTAYGLSMASLLRGPPWRRAVGAQLVIDETTAMARAQDGEAAARGAFWATGASVFVCWNLGTLAGAPAAALAGGLIAVVLLPLTPAGTPVIVASLGVLVGLRVRARAGRRCSGWPPAPSP